MKALVVAGGWAHPADQTTPPVVAALGAEGYAVTLSENLDDATEGLAGGDTDLLVVDALMFSMADERYTDDQRGEFAQTATGAWREAVEAHLRASRPLLALHTAPICFDDWPRWGEIVGGSWNWGRSMHPPPGPFTVETVSDHPVVAGLGSFEVTDERYSFLDLADGVEVLAVARDGDDIHEVVWVHSVGGARVAYSALGHDARSYETEANRVMLRRAIRWVAGMSDDDVRELADA